MPELPEVETIRLGLASHVLGRRISRVQVPSRRAARHEFWDGRGEAPPSLGTLAGRAVTEVARRGKFLWLGLDGEEEAIALHLGMSGQLLHHGGQTATPSHLAAVLSLDDGSRLIFRDQRTFGWIRRAPLVPTADGAPGGQGTERSLVPLPAAHIARDPRDPHLDLPAVVARIRRSKAAIKALLLDQGVVSGIGNIYADETLFLARVHPLRPGSSLSARTVARIIRTSAEVMGEAIAAGGTSFDALYVNTAGEAGYFERELRAYGRGGEECLRCGRLMERMVIGGRTSHLCPRCQK